MNPEKRYFRVPELDKYCPDCHALVIEAWYDKHRKLFRFEQVGLDLSQILMPVYMEKEADGVGLE